MSNLTEPFLWPTLFVFLQFGQYKITLFSDLYFPFAGNMAGRLAEMHCVAE